MLLHVFLKITINSNLWKYFVILSPYLPSPNEFPRRHPRSAGPSPVESEALIYGARSHLRNSQDPKRLNGDGITTPSEEEKREERDEHRGGKRLPAGKAS